jgi:SAM-dependent methyltransferase
MIDGGTEMTTHAPPGLDEFKRGTRAMWAAGDFPEIAKRTLWEVGERLVRRVGVGRGEEVLDVACGTGNVALRAAQAGGRVVGLDLTPELLDAGRVLAAEAGVEVEWVEGDAESLPYEPATFDVVLSTFGCMFAPRHETAADELARVLRPGGRLGICSWTPEGIQGELFGLLGRYGPPPPPFAQPPLLWGSEDHVRELFAGTGVHLEFARETVLGEQFATGEEAVEFASTNFGPLMMLRSSLEATGAWADLSQQLAHHLGRNEPAEYLITTGRKS